MTASRRTTRQARHFDSLEQEVFLSLWRTYDRLRMVEDELFSRFGLTSQQYNALRLLRAEYPESLATLALANRLVSRAPDITRLLDKLHEQGLIVRERPAENRRMVRVAITDAGLARLDEIAKPLQECHLRQLGHLTAPQLRQLGTLLQMARAPHETNESEWA